MLGFFQRDEKLRAIGILSGIRHGEHSPGVVEEPGVEGIPKRPAPSGLAPGPRTGRVPALDHEPGDKAVEQGIVIVPALTESDEVPSGSLGEVAVQFEIEIPLSGLQLHVTLLTQLRINMNKSTEGKMTCRIRSKERYEPI
jgi:hypothetical protein